jgi:hypothetical protein
MFVYKINADNVFIQFFNHIHWVCKFLSFYELQTPYRKTFCLMKQQHNFAVFEICLGLMCKNAKSNDSLFMQVTAAPVSNNQEKVLFIALMANLGLILSPLRGVIISNSSLQVAIEIVHKLRINCEMTLGAWMRGVIRLMRENPAAVPVDLFHFDHCCWSCTL